MIAVVGSLGLALLFTLTGMAKLQGLPTAMAVRDRLGVSPALWRGIGVAELAGAFALVVGAVAMPNLALLALGALTALMVGSVVAHVRVSDRPGGVVAGAVLLLCLVDVWLVVSFR
ncbi:MAG: DoxX family protein [Actinomycetes bacterium]